MRRSYSIVVMLFALVGSSLTGSLGVIAQGTTYTDAMDSAETGLFREGGPDPGVYRYRYVDGVFMMEAFPSDYAGEFYAYAAIPELLGSSVEVDTAILSEPTGRYVFVGCRAGQNDDGYLFELQVDTGDVRLWRMDSEAPTIIAESNAADVVNLGNDINRIGIECIAQIMTGSVNGEPVLSEFDPTYASGATYIGAGVYGDSPGPVSAGFDNFEVQDLGNVQLVGAPTITPTQTMGSSGETAPIRDPNIDPAGTLEDAFAVSMNLPPVISGLSDDTQVSPGTNVKLPAGVRVADFYAEFTYITPTLPAKTGYLVGFTFWADVSGKSYDVYLGRSDSTGPRWGYGQYTSAGGYRPLLDGDMPATAMNPTPGAINFVSLTVYQGVAILSGNTHAPDVVIPLEGMPIASDVSVEIGFFGLTGSGVVAPLVISTSDFAVWDLSSGLAPVANKTDAVVESAAVVEAVRALV